MLYHLFWFRKYFFSYKTEFTSFHQFVLFITCIASNCWYRTMDRRSQGCWTFHSFLVHLPNKECFNFRWWFHMFQCSMHVLVFHPKKFGEDSYHESPNPWTIYNGFGHLKTRLFTINTSKSYVGLGGPWYVDQHFWELDGSSTWEFWHTKKGCISPRNKVGWYSMVKSWVMGPCIDG